MVSKLRIVISLILIYDSWRFSVPQSIILILFALFALFASILVDTTIYVILFTAPQSNESPYIGIIINVVDVL